MTASRILLSFGALALILLGAVGGALWQEHRIPALVEKAIMAKPEMLPAAIEKLRAREQASQLAAVGSTVYQPFPGAVLGNPQGTITLVQFTDFACGYCRKSEEDVAALIRTNPDLKVVIRHMPILSPQSGDAARMALAAAEQGKYAVFHQAMFAAGRPAQDTIAAAAQAAGLDMARAQKVARDAAVGREIENTMALAQHLGFTGTPSWVIGGQIIQGAVGADRLAEAIAAARKG